MITDFERNYSAVSWAWWRVAIDMEYCHNDSLEIAYSYEFHMGFDMMSPKDWRCPDQKAVIENMHKLSCSVFVQVSFSLNTF